jgi:hypothetical protein
MHQCRGALVSLFPDHVTIPPIPSLKRKSVGELQDPGTKRQAVMSPILPSPYPQMRNSHQQLVDIQPRPVSTAPNGYAMPVLGRTPPPLPVPTTATQATSSGTGRKRGRPSKAAKEQLRPSLPTTYAPISPAPTLLAPLPTQPAGSESYGSPVGPAAYTTTTQAHDPTVKRKSKAAPGRASASPASIPRTASPHVTAPEEWQDETERQGPDSGAKTTPRTIKSALDQPFSHANEATDHREGPEATRAPPILGQHGSLPGIDRILVDSAQPRSVTVGQLRNET